MKVVTKVELQLSKPELETLIVEALNARGYEVKSVDAIKWWYSVTIPHFPHDGAIETSLTGITVIAQEKK
jgi:hypothetical protein